MRHEWTDSDGTRWGADDQLGALVNGEPCDPQACDSWPDEMLSLAERERKLREALADYLNEDECHCEETESGPCIWCAGSALLKEK